MPDIEVLGLDDVAGYDEPVEDQPTFEGNALLKARAGCRGDRAAAHRRRQRPVRRRAQRHAGGALGPVVGPAQGRRAQQRAAARPARRRTRRTPRRALRVRGRVRATPDGRERVVEGRDVRVGSSASRAGAAASATTSLFVADEHADAGLTSAELRRRARRTASRTAAGRCASWRRTSPRTCQRPDDRLARPTPGATTRPPQGGEDEHDQRVDRGGHRDLDLVEDLHRDEDRQGRVVDADLHGGGDGLRAGDAEGLRHVVADHQADRRRRARRSGRRRRCSRRRSPAGRAGCRAPGSPG